MFCTQCGKAITDQNPFCTNCGARTQSVSSETKVPDSVKPIPRRPVFRVGSLREWVNFVLWLFYLFIVWGVHTLYAAFLLISALLLVGPLHLAWRKKQATSVAKGVFLWVPVPVSALLLAMSVAKMTPYAYPTDRRGAVSVRVDRWSGCSWMRAASSSEEWGNLDCPNDDFSWLSEFTQTVEQPRENDAHSKRASTPTPVSQVSLPFSPVGKEAANSATTKPVDLLAGEFVITRGSLADQSGWRKVTIGVDANGELYIVKDDKATKWNPETETWAFGDPVAWTNARDLMSQRPAVVTAMCRRHVDVWVFDEILMNENGRIAHAATEPACRLVGELDAFAPTAAPPTPAKPPTPSGRLLEETKFGDYTIRIALETKDPGSDSVLEILKQGTRVYESKNHSIAIHDDDDDAVPVGADVTGLGVPDLVVKEYSGGAHCCTSFEIFELGTKFRKLATIEAGNCGGGVRRQSDGGYVFSGCDEAVRMYGSCFADSAAPQVTLRYVNGSFHLAPNLMRKRPPSMEELKGRAAEIASNPTWSTQDVPGAFWQYVIDLTYSGNSRSADQFIALAWPTQRSDKNQPMQEFLAQLKKSPYWGDIQALNAK